MRAGRRQVDRGFDSHFDSDQDGAYRSWRRERKQLVFDESLLGEEESGDR